MPLRFRHKSARPLDPPVLTVLVVGRQAGAAAMALAGTGAFAEILDGEVYKYYAEGEWRASGSGKSVPIVNPTTRKTQYRVQGAGSRLCSPVFFFACP